MRSITYIFLALGGAVLGCAAPSPSPSHTPAEPAAQAPAAPASLPAPAASLAPVASPASASPPEGTAAAAASPSSLDGRAYFGDQAACFVMLDVSKQAWTVSDDKRCNERFLPFSTFKIPNALIGLETGVLKDASTKIPWDSARYPAEDWWPKEWRQALDLRAAMVHSAVPYFRAMALRIGEAAMQRYLTAFGYGNARMGGALDSFWLDGEIAISAVEQVRFLLALHEGKLPVSARSMEIVKDILVWERGDSYVVRAKTGTGTLASGEKLGWFVGYVEVEGALGAQGPGPAAGKKDQGNVYLFALNMSGATFDDVPRPKRVALTSRILADLGALPKGTLLPSP